ncbi:hypothetical protein ABPG74_007612 [Tetrahymena malaccensis]
MFPSKNNKKFIYSYINYTYTHNLIAILFIYQLYTMKQHIQAKKHSTNLFKIQRNINYGLGQRKIITKTDKQEEQLFYINQCVVCFLNINCIKLKNQVSFQPLTIN